MICTVVGLMSCCWDSDSVTSLYTTSFVTLRVGRSHACLVRSPVTVYVMPCFSQTDWHAIPKPGMLWIGRTTSCHDDSCLMRTAHFRFSVNQKILSEIFSISVWCLSPN